MLTVALIQTALYWENPTANLAMLEEKIAEITQKVDLIVLPEMFTTGFSMKPEALAEPMNLTTFRWMRQMAAQSGAVVTGSYIVQEKGQYFNRLLWMQPNGEYDYYDKRHLFRMGKEHEHYTEGQRRIIKEINGWRICPLICYDLRFPVWARNQGLVYDVLLYVANWPAVRRDPWNTLLQARAIENLSYVLGVNRVGEDGHGVAHSGDSVVIDFKGDLLTDRDSAEKTVIYTLDKDALVSFRERFPAHLDADAFEIQY
ncbi:amidohydrolase [Runella sp. MFBS21]|uniref:amidohydrolase n=1 Tax=Runella sp. MFBS21 TaxID=3034018 RepID=UPI0023F72AFE|nr:amidohydrolase [Runella sp. MFBS21]MDF7817822.1 amidohydrolase [Runella sp. MFBS21]